MVNESKSENQLLKKYDAFIFDWDGTLNRLRFLLHLNEMLKRLMRTWNSDDPIKRIEKNKASLKKLMTIEETKNDALVPIVDAFLTLSRPSLNKGTIELLHTLKKNHKKIALFSNGAGSRLSRELSVVQIADQFDLKISAKDLKLVKPDPRGLKMLIKTLGVKPSRCLYIGDMCDDILTADLAGVDSCAVASGFDSYHRLKSTNPDHIFRSISEFERAVSGSKK